MRKVAKVQRNGIFPIHPKFDSVLVEKISRNAIENIAEESEQPIGCENT